MALFFIEMQQGVVAKPEVRVQTSQLASCTFIAGYNVTRGLAGAYHYPADGLLKAEVSAAMEAWWACLQPERVTLVFAAEDTMTKLYSTSDTDMAAVTRWVINKGAPNPTTKRSRAPKMSVSEDGQFAAGEGAHVPGNFLTGQHDLTSRLPGHHNEFGGFTLFDSNGGRVAGLRRSEANLVY